MQANLQKEALQASEIIFAAIESMLPDATVYNLGQSILILHRNTSVSTVFPIAGGKCDFASKLFSNESIDKHDLTDDQCWVYLKRIDLLTAPTTEQTTTAQVAPAQKPVEYSGSYQPAKKWWPQGNLVPNGNPAGSIVNLYEAQALVEKFSKLKPTSTKDDDDARADDDEMSLHEALRELAVASGQSADILKNKSLIDLTGLGVEKSRDDNGVELQVLLESLKPTPTQLEGKKIHSDGKPVSILENRDISKPFQGGLGGKQFVDLGPLHGGVHLVDKSDLPRRRYLSNAPASEGGVCLVENIEDVCYRRPKFYGMG